MSKEMDDLLRRNQNPPVNECMLNRYTLVSIMPPASELFKDL